MSRGPQVFVFDFSEDGEVSLDVIEEHRLPAYLNENYADQVDKVFLDSIDRRGIEYTVGTLIIKGEIIKPQPAQVVKTWTVES